jgi:hypothetical protein
MAADQDSERSRRLLFATDLEAGTVRMADLARAEVRAATRSRRVPSALSRRYQASLMRRGALGYEGETVARAMAARRAVLGPAATGPPRLLVRVDAFPHPLAADDAGRYGTERFRRVHDLLSTAGVRYLTPVTPRVSYAPLDPHGSRWRPLDDGEIDQIAQLRRDGVTFAAGGLDHRTRRRGEAHLSEFAGRKPATLGERLDEAAEELAAAAIRPDVIVPPWGRFGWRLWPELTKRYMVVGGRRESLSAFGYHDGPLWRGDAVWMPAYPPLHGTAVEVLAAVRRLEEIGAALWVPIVLDWARESDEDLAAVARAAAPFSTDWEDFLAAVRFSRVP